MEKVAQLESDFSVGIEFLFMHTADPIDVLDESSSLRCT